MDKFCNAYFEWDRIEDRYGINQGEIDPKVYNFHLQIVEMYYKYFHGLRVGAADLPYRIRKQLHKALMISFVKRCFLITYKRYYDFERSDDDLLIRFELYRQFLPRLPPFAPYFLIFDQ